jgi:hypothetical protein
MVGRKLSAPIGPNVLGKEGYWPDSLDLRNARPQVGIAATADVYGAQFPPARSD